MPQPVDQAEAFSLLVTEYCKQQRISFHIKN